MLYDNAQLARVYLHAWQVTGDQFYRIIAEETLDYVVREMADPAGGFYATQDADSEGEEGKFFLWTPERFMSVYGVTGRGNFEGKNILELKGSLSDDLVLCRPRSPQSAPRAASESETTRKTCL
jgi:uncharacterized protein YyaL (SSP411 family)